MTRRKAILTFHRKIHGKASFDIGVEGGISLVLAVLLLEPKVRTLPFIVATLFEIFNGVDADHSMIQRYTLRSH